ncbi:MAG: hypothetical protein LLG14_27485 [Nocardiaceae bacterium]|nr:hypothetical protein [Nocardiaceae bacterium]
MSPVSVERIRELVQVMAAGSPSDDDCVDAACALKHSEATLEDSFRLSDQLTDWINRVGPVLKNLLDAYERRVRSSCTSESELVAEPWKCAEWIAAKSVLDDKPVAVVELNICTAK